MESYETAVREYTKSKQFQKLAFNSKRSYLNGIDTLEEYFGGRMLRQITRPMVIAMRDKLYDAPGKCREALSTLNNILKLAYDRGWVEQNVAAKVGELPPSKAIERWQQDELDLFLSTAPWHLKNAMMLALYTGQRRSDLVKIRWPDYDGATIHVTQKKTGTELWIPVHPKLKQHLAVMALQEPIGDFMLVNHYDQPWSPDSLRVAIKRHSSKIGLGGRMLHGVRKTTASILGEMGCTALQIMAITGHQSLKEVQRYTAGAEKKKLAQEAMDKWQ